MKIKYISILIVLLNVWVLIGQNHNIDSPSYLPNITPPSPEAYNISKYDNINYNEFYGKTAISIPIYTYNAGRLNLPLNLVHDGSGVKINDISNWTGSNWILNTGGIITRTVKDLTDENYAVTRIYSDNILSFINQYNKQDGTLEATQFSNMIKDNNFDTELDEFNFSIPGYSGTFYLDTNFNPIISRQESELRIISIGSFQENHEFEIITPEGIKYFFGGTNGCEETIYRNSPYTGGITAFYLTKIEDPVCGQILIDYEVKNLDIFNLGIDQSLTIINDEVIPEFSTLDVQTGNCIQNYGIPIGTINTSGKQLKISNHHFIKKIYSTENNQTINFNLEDVSNNNISSLLNSIDVKNNNIITNKINFNYYKQIINSKLQRIFLINLEFNKEIQDSNSSNKKYEEYNFEYNNPEDLPERLSRSQDFLGYFNNKINSYLLPKIYPFSLSFTLADRTANFNYSTKGMLTKIIYPTGGFSVFEYEAEPAKKGIYKTYSNEINGNNIPGNDIEGNYIAFDPIFKSQDVIINFGVNALDLGTYHFCEASMTISDVTPNLSMPILPTTFRIRLGYHPAIRKYSYKFLKDHIYTIKINNPDNLNNTANNTFCSDNLMINYSFSILTGYSVENNYGIRLKRQKDYKNSNDSNPIIKRFYYSKPTELNVPIENLPDLILPDFDNSQSTSMNPDDRLQLPNFVFDSMVNKLFTFDNCINMSSSGGPPVFSDELNETHANFSTLTSNANTTYFTSGNKQCYTDVTISNGGDNFENGGIYKQFDYFPNNYPSVVNPISQRKFNIDFASKDFESKRNNTDLFGGNLLKEITFLKKNDSFFKVKQINYLYNFGLISDLMNIVGKEVYTNNIIGNSIGINTTLSNFYIGIYETKIFRINKMKRDEINYFELVPFEIEDNLPVKKTTTSHTYNYGQLKGLPVEITTTTSIDGKIIKTRNHYANEFNSLTGLNSNEQNALSNLVDQNKIAIPVQVEQYRNEDLLSTQRTLYKDYGNNHILPELIQTSKGSNSLEDKVIFDEYDAKGNPTLVSFKNGSKTKYFYNNLNQVILKVENYTSSLNIPDVPNLSDACAFINQYHNALISIFNYDSLTNQLVNIVSSNCKAFYYTYDELHNLKFIKDSNGDIIQEFDYNYKPQN